MRIVNNVYNVITSSITILQDFIQFSQWTNKRTDRYWWLRNLFGRNIIELWRQRLNIVLDWGFSLGPQYSQRIDATALCIQPLPSSLVASPSAVYLPSTAEGDATRDEGKGWIRSAMASM